MSYKPLKSTQSTTSATYNATIFDDIILADTTSNNVTVNLPAASGAEGKVLTIIKSAGASNNVIIDPNSTETLDGETTVEMHTNGDKVKIVCDGSNWFSLTRQIQVAVRATNGSGQTLTNNTVTVVPYDTEIFDTHNAYNTGTGVFTAPEDGFYRVTATHLTNSVSWAGGSAFFLIAIYINSTEVDRSIRYFDANITRFSECQITSMHQLSKGDTLDLRFTISRGANTTLYSATPLNNSLEITKVSNS